MKFYTCMNQIDPFELTLLLDPISGLDNNDAMIILKKRVSCELFQQIFMK